MEFLGTQSTSDSSYFLNNWSYFEDNSLEIITKIWKLSDNVCWRLLDYRWTLLNLVNNSDILLEIWAIKKSDLESARIRFIEFYRFLAWMTSEKIIEIIDWVRPSKAWTDENIRAINNAIFNWEHYLKNNTN